MHIRSGESGAGEPPVPAVVKNPVALSSSLRHLLKIRKIVFDYHLMQLGCQTMARTSAIEVSKEEIRISDCIVPMTSVT